jgi:hypothetical protein
MMNIQYNLLYYEQYFKPSSDKKECTTALQYFSATMDLHCYSIFNSRMLIYRQNGIKIIDKHNRSPLISASLNNIIICSILDRIHRLAKTIIYFVFKHYIFEKIRNYVKIKVKVVGSSVYISRCILKILTKLRILKVI